MAISLLQAVKDGRYVQAKLLIEQGVSVNSQTSHGSTPLLTALRIQDDQRRSRMFRWLLRMGADSTWIDGTTERDLLTWAAYLDRTDQVRWLLDVDEGLVNVQHSDRDGKTAMHYATMHGNVEALYLLVRHAARFGLSVDIRDRDGLTPYLLASLSGYRDCERILVQFGHAVTSQIFITALRDQDDSMSQTSNSRVRYGATHIGLPSLTKPKYSDAPPGVVSSTSSLASRSRTDLFNDDTTSSAAKGNHSNSAYDEGPAARKPSLTRGSTEDMLRFLNLPNQQLPPNQRGNNSDPTSNSQEFCLGKYLDILSHQSSGSYRASAVVPLPPMKPPTPSEPPLSRQSSKLSFVGVARIGTMAASLKKRGKVRKRNSKQ